MSESPEYKLVTDSHYRVWLKEIGYGFIGRLEVDLHTRKATLRPMNKGFDMTEEELEAAYQKALEREEPRS